MNDLGTDGANAGLRCVECGAPLEVVTGEAGAVIATCTACRTIYDLEDLVCAPTELDALNEDVDRGIRQALE